jgi:hypothetical protein
MVKIPPQNDPTIMAMYKAMEEAQDKKKRDYLGASLIGNDCARQRWYAYNHMPKAPFEAKTLMNFEDGHRTEDLTAERLRMVKGIELVTHRENGDQYGFTALDGKFRGHCDGFIRGLIQAPKTWHIWEAKACAHKKFEEFRRMKAKFGEKQVLREWNENYYAQAQLYMHYSQLNRHYLTIAGAGGREYQSCRTEYDGSVAERYIERADRIIHATQAPPKMSENPDFFKCKWCDYKDICHG